MTYTNPKNKNSNENIDKPLPNWAYPNHAEQRLHYFTTEGQLSACGRYIAHNLPQYYWPAYRLIKNIYARHYCTPCLRKVGETTLPSKEENNHGHL